MAETRSYKMTRADERERLDVIVTERLGPRMSRTHAQRIIEEGNVSLDGTKVLKPSAKPKAGQVLKVVIEDPERIDDLVAEDIPVPVVYEDHDIIIVDKPRGMVVHPARGHHTGTLVNALLGRCGDLSDINGKIRPGIVHRLDMDTTGVLVVAKNNEAFYFLTNMIRRRAVHREYRALVVGNMKNLSGSVDAPMGRNPRDRKKMAVVRDGRGSGDIRDARTNYKVLERFDGFDLLALKLDTGRTHQIRVHMSFMGYPVAGDRVYGGERSGLRRGLERFGPDFESVYAQVTGQLLHSFRLQFPHPRTRVPMDFSAPIPQDMQDVIDFLREHSPRDEMTRLLAPGT